MTAMISDMGARCAWTGASRVPPSRVLRTFLLVVFLASSVRADDFLPISTQSARLTGTQWDEEHSKDRPLSAAMTMHELGKGDFGTAVEIRFDTKGSRLIAPLQWIITPKGEINDVWFGEEGAELKQWVGGGAKPSLTLGDVRAPACDADARTLLPPASAGTQVASDQHCWLWTTGPTQHSIRLNPARDVLRYSAWHEGNSNFITLVLQRGVGIVRYAMGSGAHRTGFELNRVFEKAKDSKDGKDMDVSGLFPALPEDAMPDLGSLSMLADAAARRQLMRDPAVKPKGIRDVKLDRKRGYLSVSSDTDGEGDVLEAALWKSRSGARFIALHVKHWTAGPEATSDVRLFEFKDGAFRLATFSHLPLPEPRDFFSKPGEQPNLGPCIAGDWQLPKTGTTIRIRPELEDDEAMLDDVRCTADQAFELRWNGERFVRAPVTDVQHPAVRR